MCRRCFGCRMCHLTIAPNFRRFCNQLICPADCCSKTHCSKCPCRRPQHCIPPSALRVQQAHRRQNGKQTCCIFFHNLILHFHKTTLIYDTTNRMSVQFYFFVAYIKNQRHTADYHNYAQKGVDLCVFLLDIARNVAENFAALRHKI